LIIGALLLLFKYNVKSLTFQETLKCDDISKHCGEKFSIKFCLGRWN